MSATMTGSRISGHMAGQSGQSGQHGQSGSQQEAQQHAEGPVARMIEEQTAKLPSDLFLWAALGTVGLSLFMRANGNREDAAWVGTWTPTLLILGLYNKIVKVAGSDRATS